jgi:outer membrane putative beta-barrel porin/alpha-amylase
LPELRQVLAGAAFAALAAGPLRAQGDPRVAQPERPTVATHAGTVAPRYVEIETGIEYDDLSGGEHQWLVPTVVKVGLARRLQFSLIGGALGPAGTSLGIGDLTFALKWRPFDHLPLLGRFAVQPGLTVPVGDTSKGRGDGTTAWSILLISSHSIGPVGVDINFGYAHRIGSGGTGPEEGSLWAVAGSVPVWRWLGWTAEISGVPATSGAGGSDATGEMITGPTCTVERWLVLDLGASIPLWGPSVRAWYAGATWNVGRI